MPFVVWMPLVAQGLIPLGLIAWIAAGRPGCRVLWLLRMGLTVVYLAAITTAGLWLLLPWYTPVVYAAAFLLAVIVSSGRLHLPRWPRGMRQATEAFLLTLLAAACASVLALAVDAGRTPANAVSLAFPLRGGTYLVVNGGGRELVNAHLRTLSGERSRPWRGQSYGVDLVKLDQIGLRSTGLLPGDPTAYAIFEDSVRAPCDGAVIAAADGAADMRPPSMDRQNMAGNHVIVRCGRVWVLLGHLRRGSIAVRAGDSITSGETIGQVGNSGNTGEPHLHIHAQLPGTATAPVSGEPVPIRFGSIYPARNTRIRS